MILRTTVTTILVVALFSGPALAFEEQNSGSTAPAAATRDDTSSAAKTPKDAFADPSQTTSDAGGTEISIPGLGKLGVLPKMDFGLELLYGAEPDKNIEEPQDRETNADGLQIRGTIKHQF